MQKRQGILQPRVAGHKKGRVGQLRMGLGTLVQPMCILLYLLLTRQANVWKCRERRAGRVARKTEHLYLSCAGRS